VCYVYLCPQGLALINGTQMITSLGAEAVERAEAIARQADIIAALTLEVLKGTTKAFDSGEDKNKGCVSRHIYTLILSSADRNCKHCKTSQTKHYKGDKTYLWIIITALHIKSRP